MNITLNMHQKVTAKNRKLFNHKIYMHKEPKRKEKKVESRNDQLRKIYCLLSVVISLYMYFALDCCPDL